MQRCELHECKWGCRSFLSPWKDENGNYKFYGRFNQGVVTLNLPDVALSSGRDFNKFWKILDERLELCHKALLCRHERLEGTLSDVAPILWQHGAFARLEKGETIDKLLHGGYSSISLGSCGLYECVKYMTGYSHSDKGIGEKFGLEIFNKINEYCDKWTKEDDIGYSHYNSPIESTTYKFAKALRRRHGVIEGITDRDYVTNAYHIFVKEKINAFDKLSIESKFQDLALGGAISYVEAGDLTQNIEVILQVMQFMYNHTMYAEFNIKSDYCQVCGYDGEISLFEEEGKMVWECPNCGNRDQSEMNVVRRTCGYCGENFWNEGRTKEIHDRELHLTEFSYEEGE